MTQHDLQRNAEAELEAGTRSPLPGARLTLPQEFASAVNLMTHPLAGMAAMSAIGFGLASHAFGIWAGALDGAAAASQRLAPKVLEGLVPSLEDERAKTVPLVRARLAVVTSLADARDAARQAAGSDAETTPTKPASAAPAAVEKTASTGMASPADGFEAPVSTVFEAPAEAGSKKPAVAKVKPASAKAKVAAKTKPAVAPATQTAAMAQPAPMERPARIDDLKAISGVGPKLEQVLNGLGIWTYAQIAGWTAAEIAWVDDRLGFSGRIGRDDWIGQAARLGGGKAKA
jgi:NADH-quinone oxidoreductase subunit E